MKVWAFVGDLLIQVLGLELCDRYTVSVGAPVQGSFVDRRLAREQCDYLGHLYCSMVVANRMGSCGFAVPSW